MKSVDPHSSLHPRQSTPSADKSSSLFAFVPPGYGLQTSLNPQTFPPPTLARLVPGAPSDFRLQPSHLRVLRAFAVRSSSTPPQQKIRANPHHPPNPRSIVLSFLISLPPALPSSRPSRLRGKILFDPSPIKDPRQSASSVKSAFHCFISVPPAIKNSSIHHFPLSSSCPSCTSW